MGICSGASRGKGGVLLGRTKGERLKAADAPIGWRNGYGKPRMMSLMAGNHYAF
jgi:hypothetical protein